MLLIVMLPNFAKLAMCTPPIPHTGVDVVWMLNSLLTQLLSTNHINPGWMWLAQKAMAVILIEKHP